MKIIRIAIVIIGTLMLFAINPLYPLVLWAIALAEWKYQYGHYPTKDELN